MHAPHPNQDQTTRSFCIEQAIRVVATLENSLKKIIRGRDDTIKLLLTALIADGHALLEDYPGSGKTTLAKTLGNSIDCKANFSSHETPFAQFRRVQFTPDLLPSDVLGVNVFEPKSATFRFQPGPVFAHIVLADEINRTGPKVQAAFLECMAERQVSIDGTTYPLDELFFVIGTQNPLDFAGTYPLPQVQLDRFLLKIPMRYVDANTELEILQDAEQITDDARHVTAVVRREEILEARKASEAVALIDPILQTIVEIVQDSRKSPLVQFGASTRAALMFKRALRAWAIVQGRDYVSEDDVKTLTPFILRHRIRFHAGVGDQERAFWDLVSPALEKLISKRV
ncbi:AAA family ATPase [bacterium]|nr:AAA family ATPase [bacterium]